MILLRRRGGSNPDAHGGWLHSGVAVWRGRQSAPTREGAVCAGGGFHKQLQSVCAERAQNGGEVFVRKHGHPVTQKGDREPSPRLLCCVCHLETSHLGRPPHPAGLERTGLHRGPGFSNGWKGLLHFSNFILQKLPQEGRSPRGKL